MDTVEIIALTMSVAWASGINLYAAIFMLGYLGSTGNIALPQELMAVTDPLVVFCRQRIQHSTLIRPRT